MQQRHAELEKPQPAMHELSLMEEVRIQALAVAEAEGATAIKVITLRVGEFAGVEPEALIFAFPVVMEGTIAEHAELRLESEPAIFQCMTCDKPFPASCGCSECSRCGQISHQLISGRNLLFKSLELTMATD